jgi:DNA-binding LytR/AlgR family response regulator
MIHAIAIDDEPLALNVIRSFCDKIDFIQLRETFTQPSEGLKYAKKFPVDLVFLDIQMPTMTGIRLAESIEQNTMVIFTTAFSDYAVKSYELDAVDYLLKPFNFKRFEAAVNKAHEYYQYLHNVSTAGDDCIFVRADYRLVKVPLSDIQVIEGMADYLKIFVGDKKPIIARMTMKEMVDKLPSQAFMRVHRSYIVPLKNIESVRNNIITISQREIPVGKTYLREFLARIRQ